MGETTGSTVVVRFSRRSWEWERVITVRLELAAHRVEAVCVIPGIRSHAAEAAHAVAKGRLELAQGAAARIRFQLPT